MKQLCFLTVSPKTSGFLLGQIIQSTASAPGMSHSPVMLPWLSLPPVKVQEVSSSTEGQVLWASLRSFYQQPPVVWSGLF